jgi:hypothetical protein
MYDELQTHFDPLFAAIRDLRSELSHDRGENLDESRRLLGDVISLLTTNPRAHLLNSELRNRGKPLVIDRKHRHAVLDTEVELLRFIGGREDESAVKEAVSAMSTESITWVDDVTDCAQQLRDAEATLRRVVVPLKRGQWIKARHNRRAVRCMDSVVLAVGILVTDVLDGAALANSYAIGAHIAGRVHRP